MDLNLGIAFGLSTSLLWAWASIIYQGVIRSHGALACNLFKTVLATGMFWVSVALGPLFGGFAMPDFGDALRLLLSGVIGMTLGDLCFFGAVKSLGVRLATLVHGTAPLYLLLYGFLCGELPSGGQILGIALVLIGVGSVTLSGRRGMPGAELGRGVVLGILGALGQAIAVQLTHDALTSCHFLPGSALRLLGATLGFVVVLPFLGRVRWGLGVLRTGELYRKGALAVFLGTFVAICLMTLCIRYTPPAIAGTLLAMTPVVVLPLSVFMLKQPLTRIAVFGACLAVAGVALLERG